MKILKSKIFYLPLMVIPMTMMFLAPITASAASLFWVHVPVAPKELHK